MVKLFRRWREDVRDPAKPVVVMIHGLFGSADNLGMVTRGLTDAVQVLSVDLRGHGRSPHAQPLSYPHMAADVRAVLAEEDVSNPIIFGHSMGGKTAMQIALDMPDDVRGIIVGDIAPIDYGHDNHDRVLEAQLHLRKAAPATRAEAAELIDGMLHDPGVAPFIMTNWRRQDSGTWGWRHDLDGIITSYPYIAAAPVMGVGGPYTGQVLFISGGNSDYIKPAYQEATLRLFPNARVQVIAGTGHWFHAEKTDQTLRITNRFIDQLLSA